MMEVRPVTLEGKRVRLEPMRSDHLDALTQAGAFEELWKWTRTYAHTPESMKEYVDEALSDAAKGAALPFVTIDKETAKVIGSTRFANSVISADAREFGGEVSDAHACVRGLEMRAGGAQDGCAQHEVSERDVAHGGDRGRGTSETRPRVQRPLARYHLL